MNRLLRISAHFFILIILIFTVFMANKSNIWHIDIHQNTNSWYKIDNGWIKDADNGHKSLYAKSMTRKFCKNDLKDSQVPSVDNTASLFFVTHNQSVRIFIDSKSKSYQLYSYGNNGDYVSGSECGNVVHCVDLPEIDEDFFFLTIQVTPSFESNNLKLDNFYAKLFRNKMPKIYSGFHYECIQKFLISSLINFLPIFLMFIISTVVFIIVLQELFSNKYISKMFLYWGLFAFELTILFFSESYAGYLITSNSFALYYISTAILSLQPLILINYIMEIKNTTIFSPLFKIIKVISVFNFILVSVSSFVKIIPFSLFRIYVCSVLIILLLVILLFRLHEIFSVKNKMDLHDIALVVACLCVFADFIISEINNSFVDLFFFSRIGLLFYVIVNTSKEMITYNRNHALRTETNALKKAAAIDIMTGVKNADFLWSFEQKLNFMKGHYGLILVKLSNIDEINKDFGNSEGQLAIKDLASLLKEYYHADNICRMRGAKFSIIINKAEIELVNDKLKKICESAKDFNKGTSSYTIRLSFGFEQFDENIDKNFDEFYLRVWNSLKEYDL